ncbi:MAG: Gldg family protein [Ardenticatenales bacterium]|nr:Gldg family protein [Ardenticatenales bacterium]
MSSPTGSDQRSYAGIAQSLERDGCKVVTVQLATSDTLSADVIVVAGAQEPFNSTELERLASFSAGGGGVLALADPQDKADLSPLLNRYGMSLRNDLVLDPECPAEPPPSRSSRRKVSSSTRSRATCRTRSPSSPSSPAPGRSSSRRPLRPARRRRRCSKTSDAAWGETDLAALEVENAQPTKDDVDAAGPLDLAVAGEPAAGADAPRMQEPGESSSSAAPAWSRMRSSSRSKPAATSSSC